ncbi:hypothetical protein RUND412_006888 [Rhizina undulata]
MEKIGHEQQLENDDNFIEKQRAYILQLWEQVSAFSGVPGSFPLGAGGEADDPRSIYGRRTTTPGPDQRQYRSSGPHQTQQSIFNAAPSTPQAPPIEMQQAFSNHVYNPQLRSTLRFRDNLHFYHESLMLWRSLAGWSKRYYKFPTTEPIPETVRARIDAMIPDRRYSEPLMLSELTKNFMVSGMVARVIVDEIFTQDYLDGLVADHVGESDAAVAVFREKYSALGQYAESLPASAMESRARALGKTIQALATPLMSRPGDPSHRDQSLRGIIAIVEQAHRLMVEMSREDCAWTFEFPDHGELFNVDSMTNAVGENLGLVTAGEFEDRATAERAGRVRVSLTPGVVRVEMGLAGESRMVVVRSLCMAMFC